MIRELIWLTRLQRKSVFQAVAVMHMYHTSLKGIFVSTKTLLPPVQCTIKLQLNPRLWQPLWVTSAQRPVFQNTKSFQVRSLYDRLWCENWIIRCSNLSEISQWEVLDFFSKLTSDINRTFKTWISLQLPYANETNFLTQYSLQGSVSSHKRPPPIRDHLQ